MGTTLAIAAGGGGDAITATALARKLYGSPPDALIVMTYSWDRLIIDPLPGPRSVADFIGLGHPAECVFEVLPTTTLRPPAGSSLPRLAGALPARMFLLDPAKGAVGLAQQITAAVEVFHPDRIVIVDVGGDAIAQGEEPELRSPIADFLALAACDLLPFPTRLLVTGLALDGELSEQQLSNRLERLSATELGPLTSLDVEPIRSLFEWHPSEANGLLVAAARGVRGTAETRDRGGTITLTDASVIVYELDAHHATAASHAADLIDSTSLTDVENIIRALRGTTEIDYEREKASRRRAGAEQHAIDLAALDDYTNDAAERGVDYLSLRRAAEIAGVTDPSGLARLRSSLATQRAANYDPPLYRTRA